MAANPSDTTGRTIAKGLVAIGILAGLWYFVGKGVRAFEGTAAGLRTVMSYEVRLTQADGKSDNVVSVACPDRFALVSNASGDALRRIVIAGQAYAQVEGGRWLKIPESMSGLPVLLLCPQAAPSANDPKDLPSLLEYLARKARVESTSQTEAAGTRCAGWRAVPRGPNPDPKPLLTICISETSHLPVEMVIGATTWTFSKWGETQSITEPTIAPLPSPTPPAPARTELP